MLTLQPAGVLVDVSVYVGARCVGVSVIAGVGVCTCACAHTCKHLLICTTAYTCTDIRCVQADLQPNTACAHAHTQTHIHTFSRMRRHTNRCSHICTQGFTQAHRRPCACMRTCALVHANSHVHPSAHIPSCISAHKFIRVLCKQACFLTSAHHASTSAHVH